MYYLFDQEELEKWDKPINCWTCGRFVGAGGVYELGCGEDGYPPEPLEDILCESCADKQGAAILTDQEGE